MIMPVWIIAVVTFSFGADGAVAQDPVGSIGAGQTKAVTCGACHGANGNSVTPAWPSLASQGEAYIVRQLHAYKDQERQDVGMQQFAATLSEQDMHDIGAYYASQALLPKGARS